MSYTVKHRNPRLNQILLEDSSGNRIYHPLTGVVFGRGVSQFEEVEWITYSDLLTSEEDCQELLECIRTGQYTDRWFYSLVRFGPETGFNYYPVPLLFGTREERLQSAGERGVLPPSERWVRRKRDTVLNYCGAYRDRGVA